MKTFCNSLIKGEEKIVQNGQTVPGGVTPEGVRGYAESRSVKAICRWHIDSTGLTFARANVC